MESFLEIDSTELNESVQVSEDPNPSQNGLVPFQPEHLKLIILSTMFSLSIVSNGCSIVAIVNRKQKLTRSVNIFIPLKCCALGKRYAELKKTKCRALGKKA